MNGENSVPKTEERGNDERGSHGPSRFLKEKHSFPLDLLRYLRLSVFFLVHVGF